MALSALIIYFYIFLQIRKYHHAFYRPENLLLFISGKVNHGSVFHAIEPIIQKILSKVIYLIINVYITLFVNYVIYVIFIYL